MSRITLRIDRITLPHGIALDQRALEAALTAEVTARLAAGGTAALGESRSAARVDGGRLRPAAGEGLGPALARATVGGLGR